METAKEEVKSLIDKLLDDCTIEDIKYHLYGVGKIQTGKEGTLSRDEAKKKVSRWTSE